MIQERAQLSPDQDKSIQIPKQVHLEFLDGFHLLRNLLQNEHNSIDTDLSKQSPKLQQLHNFCLQAACTASGTR